MPSFECSTLSGSGVPALTAALSQIASPFSIIGLPSAPKRRFSSFEEPGTSVAGEVVSSTNQTRTALGLTSGTPIGSDPDRRLFADMRTRALTLMWSTTPVALRNHGRPCSLSLTSIILAAHGRPSTTVVSTGSPAAVWRGQWRELIRYSTSVGAVPPTCGFLVFPYSWTRASIFELTLASHGKRKSPAAARTAASACVCRCRRCSNQLPTSSTSPVQPMSTGMHRPTMRNTPPRSWRAVRKIWRRRRMSRAPRRVVGWRRLEPHGRRALERLGREVGAPDEVVEPGPGGFHFDLHGVTDVARGGKGHADIDRRLLGAAVAQLLCGRLKFDVPLEGERADCAGV